MNKIDVTKKFQKHVSEKMNKTKIFQKKVAVKESKMFQKNL